MLLMLHGSPGEEFRAVGEIQQWTGTEWTTTAAFRPGRGLATRGEAVQSVTADAISIDDEPVLLDGSGLGPLENVALPSLVAGWYRIKRDDHVAPFEVDETVSFPFQVIAGSGPLMPGTMNRALGEETRVTASYQAQDNLFRELNGFSAHYYTSNGSGVDGVAEVPGDSINVSPGGSKTVFQVVINSQTNLDSGTVILVPEPASVGAILYIPVIERVREPAS